jgi:hypothetical protein
MGLKFPDDAKCMVPRCPKPVTHQLSLRMRRQDSGADWAPNAPAYFCERHATRGAEVFITYVPKATGEVIVNVVVGTPLATRRTPIRV